MDYQTNNTTIEQGVYTDNSTDDTDNNSTVDIWDSKRNMWTFVSIEDLADDGRWNYIVSLMDYDTIEQVNDEIAPCSRLEFFRRYTEIVGDDEMVAIYCY